MDEKSSPPNMTDMFIAGVELREAVAIMRAIETQPDKPPSYWWKLVSAFVRHEQGTC
jgi:hypothetical protein